MTISRPKWTRVDWRFAVLWTLLIPIGQTALAVFASSIVTLLVGPVSLPANFTASLPYPILFLLALVNGTGIGLAQWIILRTWHYRNGWWIVATALGWATGAVVAFFVVPLLGGTSSVGVSFVWVLPGTAIAVAQWFLLRRSVSHSLLWIVVNAAAWLIATGIFMVSHYGIDAGTARAVGWAVGGAALVWLLRRPLPSEVLSLAPEQAAQSQS